MRFDAAARQSLLHWYASERRDLPWRGSRDPYRILVSEIMLQQTRVETVIPRYRRFLDRFPDLASLAAADAGEVLAEWSGLGYYRRARSLHAAARAVVEQHGGEFPRDLDALRELPGIGDYTAAAVGGIAFELPRVGLDGNVIRVLCRYFAVAELPTRAAVRRQLQAAADSLLGEHPPGDVTQALMELGARVCTPQSPRCDHCPVAPGCQAAAEGVQEELPLRRIQRPVEVREAAAVIERDGRYLLLRGQRPGVLADMWEFPTLDSRLRDNGGADSPTDDLKIELAGYLADLGLAADGLAPLGEIRHGITTRSIRCTVFEALLGTLDTTVQEGHPHRDWFHRAQFEEIPLAASTRKTLELLES